MGDATSSHILVMLVSFSIFLGVYTYMFQDYLEGNSLGINEQCYSPNSNTKGSNKLVTCTDFSNNENSFSFKLANFYDITFNFLEKIPVVNFIVPLLKLITFRFGNIHPLLNLFLNGIVVLSGWMIYKQIKDLS